MLRGPGTPSSSGGGGSGAREAGSTGHDWRGGPRGDDKTDQRCHAVARVGRKRGKPCEADVVARAGRAQPAHVCAGPPQGGWREPVLGRSGKQRPATGSGVASRASQYAAAAAAAADPTAIAYFDDDRKRFLQRSRDEEARVRVVGVSLERQKNASKPLAEFGKMRRNTGSVTRPPRARRAD